MARRSKTPGNGPGHNTETAKRRTSTQIPPADVEPRRRETAGIPQADDAAEVRSPERSEDFGGRRDIETADEPVEEHDRRHHGHRRGRRDVESGQPV
jgi:hypothetical protein